MASEWDPGRQGLAKPWLTAEETHSLLPGVHYTPVILRSALTITAPRNSVNHSGKKCFFCDRTREIEKAAPISTTPRTPRLFILPASRVFDQMIQLAALVAEKFDERQYVFRAVVDCAAPGFVNVGGNLQKSRVQF